MLEDPAWPVLATKSAQDPRSRFVPRQRAVAALSTHLLGRFSFNVATRAVARPEDLVHCLPRIAVALSWIFPTGADGDRL